VPLLVMVYVPLQVPPAAAVDVKVKVLDVGTLVTVTPVPRQLAPPPVTSIILPTAKPCAALTIVTFVNGLTASLQAVPVPEGRFRSSRW
jgi:hypothetical protein